MTTVALRRKNDRVNLLIPRDLSAKLTWAEREFDFSRSDLIRKAIIAFIAELERKKVEEEVEVACRDYYKSDKRLATDWRAAESGI